MAHLFYPSNHGGGVVGSNKPIDCLMGDGTTVEYDYYQKPKTTSTKQKKRKETKLSFKKTCRDNYQAAQDDGHGKLRVLLAMSIGMTLDPNDGQMSAQLWSNKKAQPTKQHLLEEARRRYVVLNSNKTRPTLLRKPGTAYNKQQLMMWLTENPVQDKQDVDFLTTELLKACIVNVEDNLRGGGGGGGGAQSKKNKAKQEPSCLPGKCCVRQTNPLLSKPSPQPSSPSSSSLSSDFGLDDMVTDDIGSLEDILGNNNSNNNNNHAKAEDTALPFSKEEEQEEEEEDSVLPLLRDVTYNSGVSASSWGTATSSAEHEVASILSNMSIGSFSATSSTNATTPTPSFLSAASSSTTTTNNNNNNNSNNKIPGSCVYGSFVSKASSVSMASTSSFR